MDRGREPRAALVPIAALGELEGVETVLEARAAAVSLGPGPATHVFIVAERLTPAFAASVLRATGGRLLFGEPGADAFTETADADTPAGTLRLASVGTPIAVPAGLRELRGVLEIAWTDPVAGADGARVAPRHVRLAPSDGVTPTTGLIASPGEVEEALWCWPESRFEGARFALTDRRSHVVLTSSCCHALTGVLGEAFHAVDLDRSRVLYVPLGTRVEPAFARGFLGAALGPPDHVFFWRAGGVLAVAASSLAPLTRREWQARRP
jgi:hypothetical protein